MTIFRLSVPWLAGLQGVFEDYFETVRVAGRQIIEGGSMSRATREELERHLLPGDLSKKCRMANEHWRRLRERACREERSLTAPASPS